jgi:regulatory protein
VKPFKSEEKAEAESGSDPKIVLTAALRLLARREHSSEELRRKLVSKGHSAAAVLEVVATLHDKQLVSDDRFLASFVRHHVSRGHGPVRIRAELRQLGIADAMIEDYFDKAGMDWNTLAAQVRSRKFATDPPRSLAERAKQARFLQYRGFTADQIRAAFAVDTAEEVDFHEDF